MRIFKNKKILIPAIVTIIIISGICWQIDGEKSAGKTDNKSANTPEVKTINVSKFQEKKAYLSSIGKVEALKEVSLKSQLSANIKNVNVNIGDKVDKGDLLVELDHSNTNSELEKAKATIERLESNLNLKKAGATEEQVKKAESAVDGAKAGLEQARAGLEQTRANNEAMIKNAEIGVKIAKSSLNNNTTSTSQNLKDAHENLKLTASNILSTIRTALTTSGNILGKAPGTESANDVYEDYLGVKDNQVKKNAENNFIKAKDKYNEALEYKNNIDSEITKKEVEKLAFLVENSLDKINQSLVDLRITLDNSITTDEFPQTASYGPSLDGLKQQIDTQISYINQAQQNLQAGKQAVKNAEISDDNTSEQSRLSYEKALQNLEDAKSQAAANLESAQKNVKTQEQALEQSKKAYKEVTAPPRDVDLASIKASIREAEAGKNLVLNKLDKAFIKAPFPGEVASVPVESNELVNPGEVVASLVNKDGLQVKSYISSKDKKFINESSEATIKNGISGIVSKIAPKVDEKTKKIEVIIAVTETNTNLLSGEYVESKIKINNNGQDSSYLLPFKSIKVTPNGSFVYTVNNQNTIEEWPVELGRVVSDMNEVTEGLSPEMAIIANVRGLTPGEEVKIK